MQQWHDQRGILLPVQTPGCSGALLEHPARVNRKMGKRRHEKHSSIVRKLREVFWTAQDTSTEGRDGEGQHERRACHVDRRREHVPGTHGRGAAPCKDAHGEVDTAAGFRSADRGEVDGGQEQTRNPLGEARVTSTPGRTPLTSSSRLRRWICLHEQKRGRILQSCPSDSDFTPLVMRLREAGRVVIGFGEKKMFPQRFVRVFVDHFETISAVDDGPGTRDDAAGKPNAQHKKKKPSSKTHGAEGACGHKRKGQRRSQRQGAKEVPESREDGRNELEDKRRVGPELRARRSYPENRAEYPVSGLWAQNPEGGPEALPTRHRDQEGEQGRSGARETTMNGTWKDSVGSCYARPQGLRHDQVPSAGDEVLVVDYRRADCGVAPPLHLGAPPPSRPS